MSGLFRRDEEDHDYLFLGLYDAWSDLYGRSFADAQVAIEKTAALGVLVDGQANLLRPGTCLTCIPPAERSAQ
jgi:hypothetical protein